MLWLFLLIENAEDTNDFIVFASYKKPAGEGNFFFALNTEASTCTTQWTNFMVLSPISIEEDKKFSLQLLSCLNSVLILPVTAHLLVKLNFANRLATSTVGMGN